MIDTGLALSLIFLAVGIAVTNTRKIISILEEEGKMGKKMNNVEYVDQLMYGLEGEGGMSDKDKAILLDAIKKYDDGSTDGKGCRVILAHAILDCYQFISDEEVKTAFRQIQRKYMNSNRDRISKEESDVYVEFMKFMKEEGEE